MTALGTESDRTSTPDERATTTLFEFITSVISADQEAMPHADKAILRSRIGTVFIEGYNGNKDDDGRPLYSSLNEIEHDLIMSFGAVHDGVRRSSVFVALR
jgi:hypothetical protein